MKLRYDYRINKSGKSNMIFQVFCLYSLFIPVAPSDYKLITYRHKLSEKSNIKNKSGELEHTRRANVYSLRGSLQRDFEDASLRRSLLPGFAPGNSTMDKTGPVLGPHGYIELETLRKTGVHGRKYANKRWSRSPQDPYQSIGFSEGAVPINAEQVAHYDLVDSDFVPVSEEPVALQAPSYSTWQNAELLRNSQSNAEQRFGEILGRCDISRQCNDGQYCAGMFCYQCREKNKHCFTNGQCCQGLECQFGYCTSGVKQGDPGTFCDRTADCLGDDLCCVLELSVDRQTSICKPMLNAHEACGPINLFHQQNRNEALCGPCKPGLACMAVGLVGHHNVCLPVDHE